LPELRISATTPYGGLHRYRFVHSKPVREFHVDDVVVPVDPDTLGPRLEVVGFTNVRVELASYEIRFNATKP
jgi:hypothetical protein